MHQKSVAKAAEDGEPRQPVANFAASPQVDLMLKWPGSVVALSKRTRMSLYRIVLEEQWQSFTPSSSGESTWLVVKTSSSLSPTDSD